LVRQNGDVHLLIVAKQPVPGRVKTRLIGAFGPEGAASLAHAALIDTFEAARSCTADRVVVAFDGDATDVVPRDFEVVAQRAGTLADRLAGAWASVGGSGLQIGMDTPQVTGPDLDAAFASLDAPGTDAVLGPAEDGGWWAIGMQEPIDVFAGIATSRVDTGARQLDRLRNLGLVTSLLPTRRDVDHPADAIAVAALAPWSHFAATLTGLFDQGFAPTADGVSDGDRYVDRSSSSPAASASGSSTATTMAKSSR